MLTTIKVAGTVYEITPAEMDEYGRCDYEQERILIRHSLTGMVRAKTELHEIIHAIWDEYDLPKEQEESCVRRLESGMTSFIVDNPDYARDLVSRIIESDKRYGGSEVGEEEGVKKRKRVRQS
jgi:hypothetical protein